jgi:hypothetical protein
VEWRRDDRGEGLRRCRLLKGLLGYRREGERKQYRFLYVFNLQTGGGGD